MDQTSNTFTRADPTGVAACDCHVHVVGPHSRYPLVPVRSYTPQDATVSTTNTPSDQSKPVLNT